MNVFIAFSPDAKSAGRAGKGGASVVYICNYVVIALASQFLPDTESAGRAGRGAEVYSLEWLHSFG